MKKEQYDGLELNVVKFNTEETIMMSGDGGEIEVPDGNEDLG